MSFLETAILFSKVAILFYILISKVWGFQFLYVLVSVWYCQSFILAIVVDVWQYHIVIIVCISLETLSVISHTYLPFIYVLWGNIYSNLVLKKLNCVFIIDLEDLLYFRYNSLIRSTLQTFSSRCSLFIFLMVSLKE